jgi:hypothetical protein
MRSTGKNLTDIVSQLKKSIDRHCCEASRGHVTSSPLGGASIDSAAESSIPEG